MAPLILDHDTGWKCVVSFMPWALYIQGKYAYYQPNRGLGGHRANINMLDKRQLFAADGIRTPDCLGSTGT
jgi:hypothetical protein